MIDWYSRYVIAWRLSNTLDGSFCLELLEEALSRGTPEVFNTDQGVQFTAEAFTGRLISAGVAVVMCGVMRVGLAPCSGEGVVVVCRPYADVRRSGRKWQP